MTPVERFAYRHVRSFRRETGGLYEVYVAVYSRVYGGWMTARHRRGRHARLLPSGRCTWCGVWP